MRTSAPWVATARASPCCHGTPWACNAPVITASYTPIPPGVTWNAWDRMVKAVTATAAAIESSIPRAFAATRITPASNTHPGSVHRAALATRLPDTCPSWDRKTSNRDRSGPGSQWWIRPAAYEYQGSSAAKHHPGRQYQAAQPKTSSGGERDYGADDRGDGQQDGEVQESRDGRRGRGLRYRDPESPCQQGPDKLAQLERREVVDQQSGLHGHE